MRNNLGLTRNVALVGAPNSGKTTLYNWLTNSHFRTVNYPGATIEYSLGKLAERYHSFLAGESFLVMDTPGTYSLFPKSADEEITVKAIFHHPEMTHAGKIILVVDGTQMRRHLLMAKQLQEAGFSFVIALTMSDLLKKNKIELDLRILEKEFQTKVIPIDGLLGGGITELIEALQKIPWTLAPKKLTPWSESVLSSQLERVEYLVQEVIKKNPPNHRLSQVDARTVQADRLLLHPFWGMMIFFLIMWALFSTIYWGASPLMDLVDQGFKQLNDLVLGWGPGTLWADFLANGVIASFGAVLIFVPQIFILFLGIGILEASGYLARAATLIDKPFSKLGMSGRSFVPVLSGFACAVPAIMATRNMTSARDRWITNFIIPLMSCSARLPVYALLLGFVFIEQPAWKAGLALTGLYLGSILVGSIAAAIVNQLLAKGKKSLFMMELPMYRRPQWQVLLRQTTTRTKSYIVRAGPVIFTFAVLIWLSSTFPHYQASPEERLQSSYLSSVGRAIEPVFTPMGVDWRVGVGLMSAFAAREVFVSSMAMMFNITEEGDAQSEGLLKAMAQAQFPDGEPIFTLASVAGLLIFFMIALQCTSTVAIQMKENGSWKFAIFQLVVFNIVAYVLAVGVVHGFRALGIA